MLCGYACIVFKALFVIRPGALIELISFEKRRKLTGLFDFFDNNHN